MQDKMDFQEFMRAISFISVIFGLVLNVKRTYQDTMIPVVSQRISICPCVGEDFCR